LGEARYLITSTKKHNLKRTVGPQSTGIHWQWYPRLEEGMVHFLLGISGHLYWPVLAMAVP